MVHGAVEFVSSCSNSIIFLAVLNYSNVVSNSCCKWWQQIHLKSLFTTVKSEILGAFVLLLLTTTVILIWYDMIWYDMAHTTIHQLVTKLTASIFSSLMPQSLLNQQVYIKLITYMLCDIVPVTEYLLNTILRQCTGLIFERQMSTKQRSEMPSEVWLNPILIMFRH